MGESVVCNAGQSGVVTISDFEQSCTRFRRWFVDDALPLWAARGYDHERGGFYEALNFDATPSDGRPRRVRAQARQIHTFSQAGLRGWHQDAETLAAKGFDYFLEKACPENGVRGCVHLIDDNGAVLDDKRDLYDQAFLLLACASRWEAAKDTRAMSLADKTIDFMNEELASPYGGWVESDARELPRRQNPHIHLFEAFMALYRATSEDRYFNLAVKLIDDGFPIFYDPTHDVIVEYFNKDFSYDLSRQTIEPGHMFEWVWLLALWEKLSDADFSGVRSALFVRGVHFGEDPKFFGFVKNQAYLNDERHPSAKRLWPQTEYLKACCAQGASGDSNALPRAVALIDDMFASYLNAETPGLWIDEFDVNNAPVAQDVPASILYHLFEAVAETERAENIVRAS